MMRRLILAALLCVPCEAWAAVSLVQCKAAASTTPFAGDGIGEVVFDAPTSAGSRVLTAIGVEVTSRTITSVTDDGSNTYALAGGDATTEVNAQWELWVYATKVTTPSSTITWTLSSATGATGKIVACEIAGDDSTATGSLETAVTADATGTTHNSGDVTCSGNCALFGFVHGSSGSYTIDADFTEGTSFNTAFGTGGTDMATAGAQGLTTATVGNEATGSILVKLDEAAAGGGGCPGMLLRGVCE